MAFEADSCSFGVGGKLGREEYTCARCGVRVHGPILASIDINLTDQPHGVARVRWIICTNCGKGTVKESAPYAARYYPSVPFGAQVDGLPEEVEAAYQEARNCTSVGAYTGAELLCRKVLMYVACNKAGANHEGATFSSCLDAIENAGYITKPMRPWVERIRKNGNEATHNLTPPSGQRAQETLEFTEQLLTIVYEMDHRAQKYMPEPKKPAN